MHAGDLDVHAGGVQLHGGDGEEGGDGRRGRDVRLERVFRCVKVVLASFKERLGCFRQALCPQAIAMCIPVLSSVLLRGGDGEVAAEVLAVLEGGAAQGRGAREGAGAAGGVRLAPRGAERPARLAHARPRGRLRSGSKSTNVFVAEEMFRVSRAFRSCLGQFR